MQKTTSPQESTDQCTCNSTRNCTCHEKEHAANDTCACCNEPCACSDEANGCSCCEPTSQTHPTKSDCGCCCNCGSNEHQHGTSLFFPPAICFVMLVVGLLTDGAWQPWVRLVYYLIAITLVAKPILHETWHSFKKKDFFNEFSLMSLAAIGGFALGEYAEAVAVLLFYTIGEIMQGYAVRNARNSIKSLIDLRPDTAYTQTPEGEYEAIAPDKVKVGSRIRVRPGERIPLDGELLEDGSFDTSALTGESRPRSYIKGEEVMSGMICLERAVTIRTTKPAKDSAIARILQLVEEAGERKAQPELFIRKFARYYTPAVFVAAVLVIILPIFFVEDYNFATWCNRALVFLVLSCPCALVVSVPLSYFSGIGLASKNGILFKGANYLDLITLTNTVVCDKTGTLTKGNFTVESIYPSTNADTVLQLAAALESDSLHPIAVAIRQAAEKRSLSTLKVSNIRSIEGKGILGSIDGISYYIGNAKLMDEHGIAIPTEDKSIGKTEIYLATEDKYIGAIAIADELKPDAKQAIQQLKKDQIKTVILSGDTPIVTNAVASQLLVDEAYGGLLPHEKVQTLQAIKQQDGGIVAFVGDGINDAPVLAMADISMAMGALGSDAAIEVADVVIETDEPQKIIQAIRIGKDTKRIVWQNIILALGVKLLVLLMGAIGIATMWEAIFADVGVTFIAVLNALRLIRKRYPEGH